MGNGSSLVRLPVVAWSVDKTRRRGEARRGEARVLRSRGRPQQSRARACVRACVGRKRHDRGKVAAPMRAVEHVKSVELEPPAVSRPV
jgi:hypothetical protein